MGRRREPRKDVQVPVRIFGTDSSGQVFSAKAVTVNISQQGVELSGVEPRLVVDEIIGLSYGKNRVHFRVKWQGQPGTPKAGCVGLLNNSPEKPLWDFPLPSPTPDNHQPQIAQQRTYPRIKCSLSLEIRAQDGASSRAKTSDLSLGGCYVETSMPMQPGSKVRVALWVGETKVSADCEVAYSTVGMGFGVRFVKISPEDLETIRQFLAPLAPFAKKSKFQP